MNNTLTIIIVLILILAGGWYFMLENSKKNNQNLPKDFEIGFTSISSTELDKMLQNKDFKLVDVHIPEQRHIADTDFILAYNDIEEIISALPDKNEKIVLYCRSGGMSNITARELAKRGYTNVFELKGGLNAWTAEGRETLSIGSINNN